MIELLAPAGNLEILKAAVDCGADAVYCGLSAFNARINAANFTIEEFREGASYCHYRGSKIYLTLNTLAGNSEIESCAETAVSAYEAGCDGILIQDVGLARFIHDTYPMIPLHCSTQMNIFADSDFKALSEMGFSRVVLPRELSLQEISRRSKIASRYKIQTEVFAHGAVCVCYSGLCLFSAMNRSGSRSGNRGLCAQPCREEYSLFRDDDEIRNGHLLSPKDRDVVPYVSDLINAGVASLKIEGRMRDKNYVMSAVSSYRKIIDSVYDGSYSESLARSVRNDLLVNFNRGGDYTTQFLTGKKPAGFLSGEYPGKFGFKIGSLLRTDPKKGTVTISFKPGLPMPSKGDFLSLRTGGKEVCSFPVGKIHEMPDSIAVKGLHPDMISQLEQGLDVFLMGHQTVIERDAIRKTSITLSVDVSESSIICNASTGSNIYAEFEVVLPSGYEGSSLTKDRITSQLSKTGDTPFRVENVYFTGEDTVRCPVSLINELRRGVIDALIKEIDSLYIRPVSPVTADTDADPIPADDDVFGTELTMYTYPCIKNDPSQIALGADIYSFSIFELGIKDVREQIIDFVNRNDVKLCLMLPDLYHDRTAELIDSVARSLKESVGDRLCYYIDSRVHGRNRTLSELGLSHLLSGGANIYNSLSFKYACNNCAGVTFSYELSTGEIDEILHNTIPASAVIFHSEGPIPWMQTDFCPVGGNTVKCGQCFDEAFFTMQGHNMDDEVYIIPHSFDCSSTIYGNPKNTADNSLIDSALALGHSVIINKTFI